MNRVTRLFAIEIEPMHKTIEEAEKEANAIYVFVQRMMKKGNWSCKMFIGISENKAGDCTLETIKTGKKGRPIKLVVPKNKAKGMTITEPHLHIILYGNPAETLTRLIVANINKRYKRKNQCTDVIARKYPVKGERGRYISYTFNQSPKIRYFAYDPLELLTDFEFWQEYLHFKSRHPEFIYFYKNCPYREGVKQYRQ